MCIHVDRCNGTSALVLTESEKPSSVALLWKNGKMDNMKDILQFAQKIDIIKKTIAHKVGKSCLYVNW